MKYSIFSLIVILFVSCSGTKDVSVLEKPDYPNWILERPINSDYYIGIARGLKTTKNYQFVAKQNALLDLSSEISVTLNSESLFHQVDNDNGYREDYEAFIQIESQKNLEAYDLFLTWENENEYWLYYRLSKSKWDEITNDRKQKAIDDSYSYLKIAKNKYQEEDLISAIYFSVKALDALKLFMNEPLFHKDINGSIDKFCLEFIVSIYDSISFSSSLVEEKRTYLIGSESNLNLFDLAVSHPNLPFKTRSSIRGIPNKVLSGSDAMLKVTSGQINIDKMEQYIEYTFDWMSLLDDADASSYIFSLLDFPTKKYKIIIYPVWPKIHIASKELNLGETLSQSILFNEASNYFISNGLEIVDKSIADYTIFISADTYRGLVTKRMHTAILQYEFEVKDSSDNIVFQKQKRELKGVQASFPSAGINAYERSLDDFNWDVLHSFLKELESN